jgi:hypothetical protein
LAPATVSQYVSALRFLFVKTLTAKWGEPEPKAEICHGR